MEALSTECHQPGSSPSSAAVRLCVCFVVMVVMMMVMVMMMEWYDDSWRMH
jgi:hypothetical protein